MTAPRVAYQGEPGAFGEMAITQEWGGRATCVAAATFADTIALVGRGDAEYAVIPVWNSTIGDIHDTQLLLRHHAARVEHVSEVTVPVVHCVMSLPGASLATLRYVGSHFAALGQCRGWFASRPALQPCVAYDTAGAARQLAALGAQPGVTQPRRTGPPWFDRYRPVEPRALGVIAGVSAARLYGLSLLAEGVQDDAENRTRFAVVRWRAAPP